jgi:hypothetical protein
MRTEPIIQHKIGIRTARNGLSTAALCSYIKAPATPLIAPTYIIPGIPRLRCPDFSVSISPVEPKSKGVPCITAL